MPMTGQIVIKKEYFDNIKTSIDSLNSFFSSGFKNKDFPIVDTEFQLDGTIMNILSWLNNIEPSWIDDPSKVESTLKSINDATEDMDGDIYTTLVNENRTVVLDQINAFIGFKVLRFIADHFSEFSEFVNAIYTFELFTKPSHYRSVISLFSQTINLDEIADIMGEATYTLFDGTKYVTGIFSNDQIKIPQTMKQDTEISRFNNMTDLDVEIVIDESIQEAAEVNYFSETKPQHIKYDERTNTFKLSKQLQTIVDGFISGLEKCDTTEDLVKYFRTMKNSPDSFTNNVIPFILVKVFNNTGKYPNSNFNTKLLANYVKSYKSIATQNAGARRFMNYDLFSTFKTDKDGTITFMKDFLSLDLFNNPSAYISNNTLLTIFNIFDSRIYLDILYNLLSDKMKKSKYPSEDAFVKEIRARINKNSHSVNVYKKPGKPADNKTQTTKTMNEYAVDELRDFGDMSITDMQFCEQYHAVLMDEINGIGDAMYNKGVSQTMIDSYIGESYQVFGEGFFSDLFGKRNNVSNKSNDQTPSKNKLSENIYTYIMSVIPEDLKKFISDDVFCDSVMRDINGKALKTDIGELIFDDDHISLFGTDTLYHTMETLGDVMVDDPSDEKDVSELISSIVLGSGNMSNYHFLLIYDIKNKVYVASRADYSNPSAGATHVELSDSWTELINSIKKSDIIQEQETGDIPDYMKNRIDLSDETGGPKTTTTDVQLPPDVPANDFDDLADSVNARMDGGDSLEDCLGSGYNNSGKDKDARIVYNITNNYHNSFNRDSNNTTTTTNTKDDHSTGKSVTTNTTTTNTNSNNDSSTNKTTKTDNSNRKVSDKSKNSHNSKSHGVNNNNNSNGSDDTKEIKNVVRDGDQTFSTGHTIQEVFAFLESEEPLSERGDAGKPPKGDLLTTAMDADRQTLSWQQSAKRKLQKATNTGKALLKPVTRTKQWLTKHVDSLIKRDEDRVKAEIIESPSYRTSLYKAMRIALKLGLTGVCFTINGYLGAAYLAIQGAKIVDKQRLRKEVQEEFATEIKILDDKIRKADEDDTPESRKAKWQMMRLRSKMEKIMSDSPKSKFRHPNSVV